MAHGMPRLDLLQAAGAPASYRAGFWGLARIGPRRAGARSCSALRARLSGGGEREASWRGSRSPSRRRRCRARRRWRSAWPRSSRRWSCSARQVESIRAQTLTDWICVVSDDCSDPQRYARDRAACSSDDPRFVRLALGPAARLLPQLRARAGAGPGAARATSRSPTRTTAGTRTSSRRWCARSATRSSSTATSGSCRQDGAPVADTYWEARANNHSDMLSLLVANCVTGAASLFPRELLDAALPLPPAQFTHFHDHWLAVTALALGDIHYVDRPLYDYVQHAHATLGHATATRMAAPARPALLAPARPARARAAVAHALLHRRLPSDAVRDRAARCAAATAWPRRSGARSSGSCGRSGPRSRCPGCSRAARASCAAAAGDARRRVDARAMRSAGGGWSPRPRATARSRACGSTPLPPPALRLARGARLPGDPDLRAVAQQIEPLRLAVRDGAPRADQRARTDDRLEHSGAHSAKLHLARRLAERGLRVRVVTVDPSARCRGVARATSRLRGRRARAVELGFGRESPGSRSAARTRSSRPRGGPRTSPARRCGRSGPSGSCT